MGLPAVGMQHRAAVEHTLAQVGTGQHGIGKHTLVEHGFEQIRIAPIGPGEIDPAEHTARQPDTGEASPCENAPFHRIPDGLSLIHI